MMKPTRILGMLSAVVPEVGDKYTALDDDSKGRVNMIIYSPMKVMEIIKGWAEKDGFQPKGIVKLDAQWEVKDTDLPALQRTYQFRYLCKLDRDYIMSDWISVPHGKDENEFWDAVSAAFSRNMKIFVETVIAQFCCKNGT